MSDNGSKYLNRELSWLEFNQRVLDEARDETTPLLERLRFLAITGSNLDEFFMVRVGGLQTLAQQGSARTDPAGLTPQAQLTAVSRRCHKMVSDQYACYDALEPALAGAGIKRVRPGELTSRQQRIVEQVFEDEIYSVLAPIAVDDAGSFPFITNLTLSICLKLRRPANADENGDGAERMAVIPFGRSRLRFITLPSETGYSFLLAEDAVEMFAGRFFPGEEVLECVPFRVTRNADLALREDMASDLLAEMEGVLDARKQSDCVRLEYADHASSEVGRFLAETLSVQTNDVYAAPGPLDLSAFSRVADTPGFEALKFEPWPPRPNPQIDPAESMFDILARQDVLLYHPYESFEPVVRLIDEAADDPDVLAIKQTLYRTSRDSQVVAALMRAAQRGKHVTAIVELKARFDEARNIEWAQKLEQAEVQVLYGVKGLKTHAKVCLIVRREPQGIQRYVHYGTGNYNELTARIYSDVSYMTSNNELGGDAARFFNAITGNSQPQPFRKIAAAPIGLREKLLEMIEVETEYKRQGQPAGVMAKLNSLVDTLIIDALYAASAAGVKVQLNVRGICCLRPGVKGLSESISVVSIVDRFLEHSRIFYFRHGGDERVFISSADWMPRNLDRRAELLIPVADDASRERLIEILKTHLSDNVKACALKPRGGFRRIKPTRGGGPRRSQQMLYEQVCAAVKEAEQSQQHVFEPHRAPGSDA